MGIRGNWNLLRGVGDCLGESESVRGVGVSGVYWGPAGTLGIQSRRGIVGIMGHWHS